MGYLPRTDIAKDEKGDLFTVSHSIMAMWRNHFSQLLNVRVDIDVRQMEIHTAEPLVPEPSAFEFDVAIGKLKRHKPGTDQIPAELIKAGDRAVRSEVVQLINPLNAELNPICYLLASLGAHHFLHVSRIRVKLLILRLLMSYIYGAPILDVSRSHTTTHHGR